MSVAFGQRREKLGVRPSMGIVGDAYDNATAESCFASLECEPVDRKSIALTANQTSSECSQVYPETAMTVGATYPLVYHGTILQLNVESHRRRTTERAKHRTSRRQSMTTTDDN